MLFTYHCIDLQAFRWVITAASVGLDVIILYLLLAEVWRLEMWSSKEGQTVGHLPPT